MSTPDATVTITASDIAQLAGVGRSTVSNWRQRHKDFPKPVAGSAASPRFDAAAVHAWLKLNGREVTDLPADSAVWSATDLLRSVAAPGDYGLITGSLLAWRYVSDPASTGFDNGLPDDTHWRHLLNLDEPGDIIRAVERGMRAYETARPKREPLFGPFLDGHGTAILDRMSGAGIRGFIRGLDSVPASKIGEAFVSFQERLTTSARRGYDEWATSAPLVALLAAAAESIPGPVHDPAAGSGRLLLATGSRGERRVALTGQDVNEVACAQANQRALVTGHNEMSVRLGDSFHTDNFGHGIAQVVVVDPPYGMSYHDHESLYLDPRLAYGQPPKSSMDTAWLQLALSYLGPGGRAFVLQSPGSAFQSGPTGRIRAAMLKDGVVEAVVALPGGLASNTQIPLNLWVLSRPHESADPSRVLLVDQSQGKEIDIDGVASALKEWRERRTVPEDMTAGAFEVAEILSDDGTLSPQRWTASARDTPETEDILMNVERLRAAAAAVEPLAKLTSGAVVAGTQVPKMISVSDLAKAGKLALLKANERIREEDYSSEGTPVVSGSWVRGAEDEPRRISLGVLKHDPVITEPGDVLVQNTGGLAARVDTVGGQVLLSPNFQLLRLNGNVMRPDYLAEFLVTASNQRQSLGTTIQRIRVQDLKIPLLPLAEQARVTERITESRRLQSAARALLEAASTVRDSLVEGIATGVIEIAEDRGAQD
ncbi:N-6 DNA methylase [Sinomonas soli]